MVLRVGGAVVIGSIALWVVAALAVYRATRLITADFIFEPLRSWADRRRRDWPGYLASCDWCVSVYVAAVVAPVVIVWGDNRVVVGVLVALALSAVAGLVAEVDRLLSTVTEFVDRR